MTVYIEMHFMTSEDYWTLRFTLYIVTDPEDLNSSLNCMPVLAIKLPLANVTRKHLKFYTCPLATKIPDPNDQT